MATKGNDPLGAVTAIYNTLKGLNDLERTQVLTSALSLLGMGLPTLPPSPSQLPPGTLPSPGAPQLSQVGSRPKGLTELVQEKNPGTSLQRIALFAYFRERYEGQSRFGRGDLKSYFATAKFPPPANYDRDFAKVVQTGWIHEDGEQSYLTSKGVEAVEQGFAGERKYSKHPTAKSIKKKRKTPAKSNVKKFSRKKPTKR